MRDIEQLIEDAFAGRELPETAVQAIAEHVASAGFDPDAREVAGPRIAGLTWRGKVLTKDSRLSVVDAHYLRHVVARPEWPEETSMERYLSIVATIARDWRSGVFFSERQGGRTVGIIGQSGEWRGPDGSQWILVEFRVKGGHWATAFQPWRGLDHLVPDGKARKTLQWLRTPK